MKIDVLVLAVSELWVISKAKSSPITKLLGKKYNHDFFIVYQNDDFFLGNLNKEELLRLVDEANYLGADLIYSGGNTFNNAVVASKSLFWVDYCYAPSYVIILKRFYETLFLNNNLQINNLQDLNDYTENKYLILPHILEKNNFEITTTLADKLNLIKNIDAFFFYKEDLTHIDYNAVSIPTYIINLENRKDRYFSIIKEFENRPEFEIHMTNACLHTIGAVGLLKSIRQIINMAIRNDDEVIIIVEDDHVFTENYDRDSFIKNVIDSGNQGADILSGGISGGFEFVVPITSNRFWINHFWGTQFIVIYKKFYQKILKSKFGDKDTADDFLSKLSFSKMILYPFISVQKDFGYSDITVNNALRGDLSKIFLNAEKRLYYIKKAYCKIKKRKTRD